MLSRQKRTRLTNESNNTSEIIGKVRGICDKPSLDITRIKDKSLTDPDLLAADIVEKLETGIESFKEIYEALR